MSLRRFRAPMLGDQASHTCDSTLTFERPVRVFSAGPPRAPAAVVRGGVRREGGVSRRTVQPDVPDRRLAKGIRVSIGYSCLANRTCEEPFPPMPSIAIGYARTQRWPRMPLERAVQRSFLALLLVIWRCFGSEGHFSEPLAPLHRRRDALQPNNQSEPYRNRLPTWPKVRRLQ
jgi:hypothetical protein